MPHLHQLQITAIQLEWLKRKHLNGVVVRNKNPFAVELVQLTKTYEPSLREREELCVCELAEPFVHEDGLFLKEEVLLVERPTIWVLISLAIPEGCHSDLLYVVVSRVSVAAHTVLCNTLAQCVSHNFFTCN